jgi:hydrogenase maturation protease
MHNRAVIALGNPLRGDDGIGQRILDELRERELPSDVVLLDGGTGGFKLLHLLARVDDVVIVDAVRHGGAPGDHVFFTPDQVTSRSLPGGMHDPALFEVLRLSGQLDERPARVCIMGIEPACTDMGEGLSPAVERQVGDMVDALLQKLWKW